MPLDTSLVEIEFNIDFLTIENRGRCTLIFSKIANWLSILLNFTLFNYWINLKTVPEPFWDFADKPHRVYKTPFLLPFRFSVSIAQGSTARGNGTMAEDYCLNGEAHKARSHCILKFENNFSNLFWVSLLLIGFDIF